MEKEKDQFFVLAIYQYLNESKTIRFAIDKKTADGIGLVLTKQPFKENYGNDYSYWYSGFCIDKGANNFEHYIEIRLGKMRQKAKIQCSKLFCENLKWLSEIESISDLGKILYE